MKKFRVLFIVLAILTTLALWTCAAAESGTCGDNLTWTLDDEGVLTISGKGAMEKYTGWKNRQDIQSIVIEEGVTSISEWAFESCEHVTSVTIPSSVSKIESWAFFCCRSLTKVDIPEGVKSVGSQPFAFTGVTTIHIPASLTEIHECAFAGNRAMKSITVAGGNPKYMARDGILFSKDQSVLYCYPAARSGSSYTIPDTVSTLNDGAFEYNNILTEITIPDSVTEISYSAVTDCLKLQKYVVSSGNKSYCSVSGVLFSKDKTILASYPSGKTRTAYTVPAGVTFIREFAFNNSKFEEITLPEGLDMIGYHAFYESSLKKIHLPVSLTEVQFAAFDACDNLSDVYYAGTSEQWKAITIRSMNEALTNAKIHYNAGEEEPVLTSVKFSTEKAAVNTNVTITAVTNTSASKLTMYAGGKAAKTWTSGYTDADGKRTWKVTYAFAGAGERALEFKAFSDAGTATDAKTAKITITKAAASLTLSSVKFSKATATVKQKVTITAVTTTDVTQLNMYSGKTLVQSWKKGYTDADGKRTWKFTYAFGGAGKDRKLTFKGQNAKGKESAAKAATITITKAPTISSAKFSKAKAKVNEKVKITVVTSTNVTQLNMYLGTKKITSWKKGYTDKDGKRTWSVTYTFTGAGKDRKLTFKGQDANGVLTAGKDAVITITK